MENNMHNVALRLFIADRGLSHKAIAAQMGISPHWFSKIICREDLSSADQERILQAISELSGGKA